MKKEKTENLEKETKKTSGTASKVIKGTVAVTTASAMVAAIYAACKAYEKEKQSEEK